MNPAAGPITGLETWFWYDQPVEATLSIDLDGVVVTVDARAVRFQWDAGDGQVVSSETPGTATAPAGSVVCERRARYTVDTTVTWSGVYTITPPVGEPIVVPLGERQLVVEEAAEVTEIRGVRR